MRTPYDEKLRKLEARLLDGPGATAPEMRRAVADGDPIGDPLIDGYLEKIRRHAYRITEADIHEMTAAGWDEDRIFELSICAAFGAARLRRRSGLDAVEAARTSEGSAPSPTAERGA
ncbi:MAG: hypothetical protein L0206_20000 [Actinobacteria bacterium]|nr:hypothetical protein [Actinomycetota bacterium]